MASEFAVRLGLLAFAAVSVRGLTVGAGFRETIVTALIALSAFAALGMVCGELARQLAEESARSELERLKTAEDGKNIS